MSTHLVTDGLLACGCLMGLSAGFYLARSRTRRQAATTVAVACLGLAMALVADYRWHHEHRDTFMATWGITYTLAQVALQLLLHRRRTHRTHATPGGGWHRGPQP